MNQPLPQAQMKASEGVSETGQASTKPMTS